MNNKNTNYHHYTRPNGQTALLKMCRPLADNDNASDDATRATNKQYALQKSCYCPINNNNVGISWFHCIHY